MTDIITTILSIYFLIRGASRAFINSLLVPVSITIASILSILNYQATGGIIVSLIIGLFGPIFLFYLFKYLYKKWAKATNNEIKPSFLDRVGGSIITFAWGWVFIAFTLILLAALPQWGKVLTFVHKDVVNSASYFFVKPLGQSLYPTPTQNISTPASTTPNVDAKSLAEDPRFQEILQDPEIQKEIDARNIVKLMSNPKMIDLTQQIMSDPAMMKKVMAIYSSQTQPEDNKTP